MRGQPALDAGRRRRGARRRARRRGARRAAARTAPPTSAHLRALVAREPADRDRRRRRADRLRPRDEGAVAERLLGATEETTTGLVRLRAMAARGRSRCAVLAINETRTERDLQRPLRHRPVDARRDPAGDQPAARGPRRRRARIRLGGTRRRAAGEGRRRGGDRLRGRPRARARGADGGLRGDERARGGAARRDLHHRHRRPRRAAARALRADARRRGARQRRPFRCRDQPR